MGTPLLLLAAAAAAAARGAWLARRKGAGVTPGPGAGEMKAGATFCRLCRGW
jgi:hypothetical protein